MMAIKKILFLNLSLLFSISIFNSYFKLFSFHSFNQHVYKDIIFNFDDVLHETFCVVNFLDA